MCHLFWREYLTFEELHMLRKDMANLKALQGCFAGFSKHHFWGARFTS